MAKAMAAMTTMGKTKVRQGPRRRAAGEGISAGPAAGASSDMAGSGGECPLEEGAHLGGGQALPEIDVPLPDLEVQVHLGTGGGHGLRCAGVPHVANHLPRLDLRAYSYSRRYRVQVSVPANHIAAVVYPDLPAAEAVEGGRVSIALVQRAGQQFIELGGGHLHEAPVGAANNAVLGGEDRRAAGDRSAGEAGVEVDALVDAGAVRAGGVGEEVIAGGQAGAGYGEAEAGGPGQRSLGPGPRKRWRRRP